MWPSNVTGVLCPGCQPNDFPVPHICGGGSDRALTSGWCPLCDTHWDGYHVCSQPFTVLPRPAPTATIFSPAPASPCDHCFCLKQKAGWYDVKNPVSGYADRHHLKPHHRCCMCGSRRVKGASDARP